MVILPTLLFAAVASSSAAPPQGSPAPVEVTVNLHAPFAPSPAPARTIASPPSAVKDPFATASVRVVIAAAPTELRDPFAPTNLSARFRNTAPASATLRDPFAS